MRAAFLVGFSLLSSNAGKADEFSVLSTKLGMTDSQIIRALPTDLRESATRDILGGLGELPFPAVRVSAGKSDCEWARFKEYGRACLSYSALLMQKGNGFSTISISLSQYFENQVKTESAERQFKAAYGEPTARIKKMETVLDTKNYLPKTQVIQFWPDKVPVENIGFLKWPVWIWSSDLPKMAAHMRKELLNPSPNPGKTGLSAPILRMFMNVEGDGVLGLQVILIDPVAMDEWNARLDEARASAQKASGDEIKLK